MDRVESGMADPVTKDEVLDVMAEQEVSVTLGVPVKCGDYIHEVARRLRDATVH
jgi:hypothetical protein